MYETAFFGWEKKGKRYVLEWIAIIMIKSHNKQNWNFDLFLELLYSTTLPGFTTIIISVDATSNKLNKKKIKENKLQYKYAWTKV